MLTDPRASQSAPVTMDTMVIRDPEPYGGSLALVRCQVFPQEHHDNRSSRRAAVRRGSSAGFGGLCSQEPNSAVLKLPQEIEFKGPLSGPPQTVVVFGDPTKPGVFVSRVKFSAGWKDPPHWHPDSVRTAVVLSGTLYFG